MAVAFPDCYDCENASSINGELWCSLFFHPCSQTIACSRNAPKPEPKPITNADRIRSMTDEELAEEMGTTIDRCPPSSTICPKGGCQDCWLGWLKQEVESNDS